MKTQVIAEIGSNWKTLDDILHSIDWCHERGVYPKLQAWRTHETVSKKRAPKQFAAMKRYEIPEKWYTRLVGSGVFFSVFSVGMLEFIEEVVNPRMYKIASPDAVFEPLVKAVTGTGKRTIISVGGCTLDEIRTTASWCKSLLNTTFLHCIVGYPAKDMHLAYLRDRIIGSRIIQWGISSHSLSPLVPALAVPLGITMAEVHVNVVGVKSPDAAHSLTPLAFDQMLAYIEEAEANCGNSERPLDEERYHLSLGRRGVDGLRPSGSKALGSRYGADAPSLGVTKKK